MQDFAFPTGSPRGLGTLTIGVIAGRMKATRKMGRGT
jgi:hypothetical protein